MENQIFDAYIALGTYDIRQILDSRGEYDVQVTCANNYNGRTAIVNTDTCDFAGRHWLVLQATDGNNIFMVDSLGKQVKDYPAIAKKVGGRNVTYFTKHQIQSSKTFVCGYYALLYFINPRYYRQLSNLEPTAGHEWVDTLCYNYIKNHVILSYL